MRQLLAILLLGCSSGETAVPAEVDAEATTDTAIAVDTGTAVIDDTSVTPEDTTPPGDAPASETTDAATTDAPATETKSAGCATGKDLAEGALTFTVGGVSRKYTMRRPTGYTKDKAWPLVLALHPNGSNMGYYDVTTGGRAIRPQVKDKAVLVLPEANSGDWRDNIPVDAAYIDALMTLVKKEMCIDTSRMFSMGFSGGGSFSGYLGCTRSDIRAIASGGAVIYFDKAKCVGKPAAWITIGDGESIPGRIEFRDFWRTRNECTTMTKVVPPAPTCVAYTCPDPLRPTEFCSHAGGHEWPSFGAEAAWLFFSKF